MWRHDDIAEYFNIFGIDHESASRALNSNGSKEFMDTMTVSGLVDAGIDNVTAVVLLSQWTDVCSASTDVATAISQVKKTIVSKHLSY